jgi:flagellar biosynthetic protein FliR
MPPALAQLLPADILTMGLVFARVGAMTMLLPAIGEASVPVRVRLMLALALTLVLAPVAGQAYPPLAPTKPLALVFMITLESVIGIAIGLVLRMVMSAVQVAGNVIATQSGLAFAQTFDATQGVQSALVSTFLSLLAILLIFAADLHHLLISGIEHAFALFPPGRGLPPGDFLKLAVETASGMFLLGVQMAAPFLVFSLILYGASGVIARMMPQLQIFFLAMPLNILAGFVLLALSLSAMMLWFLEAFAARAQLFVPH